MKKTQKRTKRHYPEDFKQSAIDLAKEIGTKEAAEKLGIVIIMFSCLTLSFCLMKWCIKHCQQRQGMRRYEGWPLRSLRP